MVGIVPLFAVEILENEVIERLPSFKKRMEWFLRHRPEIAGTVKDNDRGHRLLAIASREQLQRVLRYVLDEREFLSPFGIRALSRIHQDHPVIARTRWGEFRVDYEPGESTTSLFGGNSNWRGPVWFPLNYLLIEALERYHYFYGDDFRVECPAGSGRTMNLPASVPWTGYALRTGPALARSHALSRILSWRHRTRLRRQPSNGLDRAGDSSLPQAEFQPVSRCCSYWRPFPTAGSLLES